MARQSRILFTPERAGSENVRKGEGEMLFSSENGIPLVWLFVFGERNVWNAGDSIEKKGIAAERALFEVNIEAALYRLDHVIDNLVDAERIWPWFTSMNILKRKFLTKPKAGFIHVHAPWFGNMKGEEIKKIAAATSMAENAVNYISQGNYDQAALMFQEIPDVVPFIPFGFQDDHLRFERALKQNRQKEPALGLATLMIGESDHAEIFRNQVEKECKPAFEAIKFFEYPSGAEIAPKLNASSGGGLFKSLLKVFGKG